MHCASTRRILGARCFHNGHFIRRISSTLYFPLFESLGGRPSAKRVSHEPCFRQAHCFVQEPLRFLHVPPNPTCARSHIWGLPKIIPLNYFVARNVFCMEDIGASLALCGYGGHWCFTGAHHWTDSCCLSEGPRGLLTMRKDVRRREDMSRRVLSC